MVKEGKLKRRFPDTPNPRDQAYRACGEVQGALLPNATWNLSADRGRANIDAAAEK
jgi:hypothetical protein